MATASSSHLSRSYSRGPVQRSFSRSCLGSSRGMLARSVPHLSQAYLLKYLALHLTAHPGGAEVLDQLLQVRGGAEVLDQVLQVRGGAEVLDQVLQVRGGRSTLNQTLLVNCLMCRGRLY